MWDPPRLGIELVSPALQGGFLTTGPPGKPQIAYILLRLRFSPGVYNIKIDRFTLYIVKK